jgi:hypothetical protein
MQYSSTRYKYPNMCMDMVFAYRYIVPGSRVVYEVLYQHWKHFDTHMVSLYLW